MSSSGCAAKVVPAYNLGCETSAVLGHYCFRSMAARQLVGTMLPVLRQRRTQLITVPTSAANTPTLFVRDPPSAAAAPQDRANTVRDCWIVLSWSQRQRKGLISAVWGASEGLMCHIVADRSSQRAAKLRVAAALAASFNPSRFDHCG